MPRVDRRAREDPIDRFNRLMGKTGQSDAWRPGPAPTRSPLEYDRAELVRRINRGSTTVPSSVTRQYRSAVGGSGGGFQYSPAKVESAMTRVFNELTNRYQENVAEEEAISRISETNEQREQHEARDRPWYQDLWHAVSGIGDEDEEGGFQDSIIGRVLDVASRPAFGVFEGLQSVAEEPRDNSLAEGADIARDFFGGVARGLTGEDKTGFGEVYETIKEADTGTGRALRGFEEAHPSIEQYLARGIGFVGELGLDPLNAIFVGAPTIMRGTEIAQRAGTAGRVATGDVFKQTMLRAAEEAAGDFATGSHLVTGAYANNPQLLTARIRNSIEDLFNRSNVEVQTGGSAARRTMNDRSWPAVVANRTTREINETVTEFFNSRVDDIALRAPRGQYTPATVDTYRQYNNDFDEFWRALETEADAVLPPNATVDDVLDAWKSGKITNRMVESARAVPLRKYASELEPTFQRVLETVKNPTYRTLGIRVGRRTIPFRAPGRAYDYIGTKLADKLIPNRADSLNRTFFENQFPGIFGLKATQARAFGLGVIDQFRRSTQKFARGYTPDEAIELQRLRQAGVRSTGDAKTDAGLDFLEDWYEKIIREEQVLGARPIREPGRKPLGSAHGNNYTYIYLRGGARDARSEFKTQRKAAWNDDSVAGPGRYDLDYAKAAGLKPVENAFENLFLRFTKSRRDIVRASFYQDMIDNYSIWGGKPTRGLSDAELVSRGLTPVSYDRLNAAFRRMTKDVPGGGKFYLPNEIAQIADRFWKMTSWTSSDWGKLRRNFVKVINFLKATLTLPFTGFHFRNLVGDVFMGLMDDINPNAYARVARKYAATKAGKLSFFEIIPGQPKILFKDMYRKFLNNADTGFFSTEFGTYNSITAGAIPKRMGRRVTNTVREWSDARETIPRFVHFTEAYTQEARALWRKGVRDMSRIDKEATNAALWRVNHYKFDYSAILPWEKTAKSLAFPFYTYLRKAIPTILEQMLINPHYLSTVNRFMEYNDGSAADRFNEMNVPQWVKDLGFGVLSNEREPMAITADILPIGALDILSSVSPTEVANVDPKDFIRETLSNLNPIAQAPIEYATGQELFSERPVQGNFLDYVSQNLPIVHDFQEEVVDIPGIPGGGNQNNAIWDYLFGEADRPLSESLIQNRFAGIGVPARRITEGQQFQQQQANVDRLVEGPLREFNFSQDQYYISRTDDYTFKVIDRLNDVERGTFQTPQEAIEFAKRLPGADYQRPRTQPYQPPNWVDIVDSFQR